MAQIGTAWFIASLDMDVSFLSFLGLLYSNIMYGLCNMFEYYMFLLFVWTLSFCSPTRRQEISGLGNLRRTPPWFEGQNPWFPVDFLIAWMNVNLSMLKPHFCCLEFGATSVFLGKLMKQHWWQVVSSQYYCFFSHTHGMMISIANSFWKGLGWKLASNEDLTKKPKSHTKNSDSIY